MGTWQLGQKVQAVSSSDDNHTRNNTCIYWVIILMSTELAKELTWVFLLHLMEKPEWNFWPTQQQEGNTQCETGDPGHGDGGGTQSWEGVVRGPYCWRWPPSTAHVFVLWALCLYYVCSFSYKNNSLKVPPYLLPAVGSSLTRFMHICGLPAICWPTWLSASRLRIAVGWMVIWEKPVCESPDNSGKLAPICTSCFY